MPQYEEEQTCKLVPGMMFTRLDINSVPPSEGLVQQRQKWYIPALKSCFTLPAKSDDSETGSQPASQPSEVQPKKRDEKRAQKTLRLWAKNA